jgi:predicted membrane channel-forming protein YqfA (hemolysin III family)
MSEEGSLWIKIAEKFFGLLLIILGALLVYFTATSSAALGAFTALFVFLSLVFLAVGVFLIVVKPPE